MTLYGPYIVGAVEPEPNVVKANHSVNMSDARLSRFAMVPSLQVEQYTITVIITVSVPISIS